MTHTRCVITDECTARMPNACLCNQMPLGEYKEAYRKKFGPNYIWFVWVDSLRGPVPQAWAEVGEKQASNVVVLAKHVFTPDDQWLSLDQLAKKYPYDAR